MIKSLEKRNLYKNRNIQIKILKREEKNFQPLDREEIVNEFESSILGIKNFKNLRKSSLELTNLSNKLNQTKNTLFSNTFNSQILSDNNEEKFKYIKDRMENITKSYFLTSSSNFKNKSNMITLGKPLSELVYFSKYSLSKDFVNFQEKRENINNFDQINKNLIKNNNNRSLSNNDIKKKKNNGKKKVGKISNFEFKNRPKNIDNILNFGEKEEKIKTQKKKNLNLIRNKYLAISISEKIRTGPTNFYRNIQQIEN